MFDGVSDREYRPGTMMLLAIFVSRFEAIEIASMLRGYGIYVSIDGEAHASAEYVSLALGGHRLRVFAEDHATASEILGQSGVVERDVYRRTPRPILLWFLGLWAGLPVLFGLLAGAPIYGLLFVLNVITGTPVDPKGRPDYFLSEPANQGA